jgi:hypothetical protein
LGGKAQLFPAQAEEKKWRTQTISSCALRARTTSLLAFALQLVCWSSVYLALAF